MLSTKQNNNNDNNNDNKGDNNNNVKQNVFLDSKSQRTSKSLDWFKSYSDFNVTFSGFFLHL